MNRERNPPSCSETTVHSQDGSSEHHHRGKSSEPLLDKAVILRHLRIVAGQIVLDAGCGNGYMAKEFSRLVDPAGKVYALDPDEVAIEALREETQGTNILATVGDITGATSLPSCSLDLAYLSMVFHGFSSTQINGFEMEAKRLLKPGGRLAIVEIAKRDTPFGPPLAVRRSPDELKQMLRLTPQATVDVGEHCYMQLFEKE